MSLWSGIRNAIGGAVDFTTEAATMTQTSVTVDDTGDPGTPTTTDFTVKLTPPEQYQNQLVDGRNIKRGDVRVFTVDDPTVGYTPAEGDTAAYASGAWTVKGVEFVRAGGVVIGYTLQLRAQS